jgi:hypothetical protein
LYSQSSAPAFFEAAARNNNPGQPLKQIKQPLTTKQGNFKPSEPQKAGKADSIAKVAAEAEA